MFLLKSKEDENILKILLSKIMRFLALFLSHYMVAMVAYNYCALEWGGKYEGYSALPETAFLYTIPFMIAILVCCVAARVLGRKKDD